MEINGFLIESFFGRVVFQLVFYLGSSFGSFCMCIFLIKKTRFNNYFISFFLNRNKNISLKIPNFRDQKMGSESSKEKKQGFHIDFPKKMARCQLKILTAKEGNDYFINFLILLKDSKRRVKPLLANSNWADTLKKHQTSMMKIFLHGWNFMARFKMFLHVGTEFRFIATNSKLNIKFLYLRKSKTPQRKMSTHLISP